LFFSNKQKIFLKKFETFLKKPGDFLKKYFLVRREKKFIGSMISIATAAMEL
jgi:hypothetical protein